MATLSYPAIRPTDSELLVRFTANRDERAFAALVKRHAGLVQAVCRRVLPNEQDAEDAFQATFLVLARSARSIRCRDSAASWLFKVAHRTAVQAAMKSHRRKETPLQDDPVIPSDTFAQIQDRETFELLAAELHRLPESYRAPLILFYLEGRSRGDAAEELECTDAAFKARLARGRQILRQRLMRRGVALSLAMTAASASSQAATASLSPAVIERTISAGLEYAATGKAGAACSVNSVSLAQGTNPMLTATLTKSSLAVGTLLAASLLAAVGMGVHQLWAESSANPNGNAVRRSAVQTVNETADNHQDRQTPTLLALGDGKSKARNSTKPRKQEVIGSKQINQSEKRILAALLEKTDIEFFDTALIDAMQFFSDLHDIPIIIDETALTEEGISTVEPITRKLSGVSLKNALDIMLKPLGIAYLVEDGVLKITSQNVVQARNRKPQAVDLTRPKETEQRIIAALSETTSIEFFDTSLIDAVQFIAELHNIQILIDEPALGEEGITTDEPISQVLSGISLESVLNITLKPLGLTYMIEDEVLKITTVEVEDSHKETRVYPTKDLAAAGIEIEALVGIIEKQADDEKVSVEALADMLAITQSQRQHRKTVDLLEQLRRSDTVEP